MATNEETPGVTPKFDFSAFPLDTLFYDRREGRDRRDDSESAPASPPRSDAPNEAVPTPVEPTQLAKPVPERRQRKDRRRRIDPTTFEKQYSDDEIEFMNAMQNFKVQTGKAFPSHGEVLRVALSLGYRLAVDVEIAAGAEEPAEIGSLEFASLESTCSVPQ